MRLSELKIMEKALIKGFEGEGVLQQRLMELGIVPGTQILLKRFAPLGDPMEIIVRGYSLSLRSEDARHILIEPVQ